MERIYGYRMTTTSGGNLSIREDNGDVWITPARIDKGSLRREDIVRVHPDGSVDGDRLPSSELPFHLEIHRRRPDLHGIVHAHPVALVAFSLAHQVPDTRLFHQAWNVCGQPGFAPYRLPGSQALGDSVAGTFEQGYNCVILENHGVVTAAESFHQAFQRFETLEFTAKTIIKARLLGDVRYLNSQELEQPRKRFNQFNTFTAECVTSAEKEIRRTLAAFIRRAYRQRLFISTQGSFSARLESATFLITPYQCDRASIDGHELVLVSNGLAGEGKTPSRAARSHAAIYERHPEIGAVINAYPVNATAFSVTDTPLDTRTIPESYVVVRSPARLPYGIHFQDREAIARSISTEQPAAVLQNDGVLVTGRTILEAFDRLEVIESTAEAIINCRAIGPMAPMGDEVVRELDAAFFGK
jgi:L-fuculose-phosphate aldolase